MSIRFRSHFPAACLLAVCGWASASLYAQSAATPSLPTVNLGLTSFLDGEAGPGWMVEEYGQGVHDDRTIAANGTQNHAAPTVNSGSLITHVVWISPKKVLGAWYGGEVLSPVVYADAQASGQRGGFGDTTVGPMLQWPQKKIAGMKLDQRVVLDFELPTGVYSRSPTALNIGANAWTVHPYYAFTLQPAAHWETSWRISYLWNAVNHAPVADAGVRSTQAGQALHLNATFGYEVAKGLYVGANGYFLHQLTDAQVNGVGQSGTEVVGALGPGMMYHRGSWDYYANAYREFDAVDRSEGNKLVLRVEHVF
ncbi:transporter [Silvibacterium sp.]|uniref:SphA family protein n=1 Tax=Silvibacterium sp. TaxID=1964179 RepID=UPI0039E4F7A9